jgi:hypothetical protein
MFFSTNKGPGLGFGGAGFLGMIEGGHLHFDRGSPERYPAEAACRNQFGARRRTGSKGGACFWPRRSFTLADEHRCAIPEL